MGLDRVRRLHAGQLLIVSAFVCGVGWALLLVLQFFVELLQGCPVSIWSCKVASFWVYFAIAAALFVACGVAILAFWWSWFGARRAPVAPSRAPLKPGELEDLISHLAYEFVMFEHSRTAWNADRQPLTLEGLLLHVRNLRDFLFGRIEEYGRDVDKAVIAADYAPTWAADRGSHRYQILWKTDTSINAQLAHLSRRRTDPATQRKLDEEAESIAEALNTAWRSFREALASTSWATLLDAAIRQQRTRLGLPIS